ncbi:MAG: ExeM/NucH family extracellular endonuclease, partial [Dermatophilaceae bacterium]
MTRMPPRRLAARVAVTALVLAAPVALAPTAAAADPACDAAVTSVGAVQGSGETAALTGPVTVRGTVVGDYEGPSPALRGFYVQDAGDGDPATSDGVFVFGADDDRVAVGDLVTVSGTAGEF